MDQSEFIYNLGMSVLKAAETAAATNKRAISMGSVGTTHEYTGKDKLIKLTIVAEPTVFAETIYPDPATHEVLSGGAGVKPIETTSVIEQLKMLDECNENSIRH